MPVRKGEMSGRCSICNHQSRYRIELALVGGASREAVGKRFNVSSDAAGRHLRNHVSAERRAELVAGPMRPVELAQRAADEGMSLLDYASIVRQTLMARFLAASEVNDRNGTALLAARLLECLRLIAQLSGELSRAGATVTNNNLLILNSPLMSDLQSMLIERLTPWPEASKAVIEGLRQLSDRALQQITPRRPDPLPALEIKS